MPEVADPVTETRRTRVDLADWIARVRIMLDELDAEVRRQQHEREDR